MSEPVITRNLTLGEREIRVTVHLPVEGERSWQCRYVITGLATGDVDRASHGIDGVQAIQGAFLMADADLQNEQRASGPISFLGEIGGWFMSPQTEPWDSTDNRAGVVESSGSDDLADRPRVTTSRLASAAFDSAVEMATAFGATILTPTWWPSDLGEISHSIIGPESRAHYQVGAVRPSGGYVFVIGHRASAWHGRTPSDWLAGNWQQHPDLAADGATIGRVGIPPRPQAFLLQDGLGVQFLGYETERDIIASINSLIVVQPQ